MQKFPFGIVGLASADDELIVFRHDFEVFAGKTGHRQSDAQTFGTRLAAQAFNIVGRITVAGFCDPFQRFSIVSNPSSKGLENGVILVIASVLDEKRPL